MNGFMEVCHRAETTPTVETCGVGNKNGKLQALVWADQLPGRASEIYGVRKSLGWDVPFNLDISKVDKYEWDQP